MKCYMSFVDLFHRVKLSKNALRYFQIIFKYIILIISTGVFTFELLNSIKSSVLYSFNINLFLFIQSFIQFTQDYASQSLVIYSKFMVVISINMIIKMLFKLLLTFAMGRLFWLNSGRPGRNTCGKQRLIFYCIE